MNMASSFRKAAQAALRFRDRGAPSLQVGALPYRRRADGSVEVLLVTTRGTGQWMVPKGWPMPGKTLAEAAEQEAFEEAGVRGSSAPSELGRFRHDKTTVLDGTVKCVVAVFPLEVIEELPAWPERLERSRSWFDLEDAARAVQSPALAALIGRAAEL